MAHTGGCPARLACITRAATLRPHLRLGALEPGAGAQLAREPPPPGAKDEHHPHSHRSVVKVQLGDW